MSVYVRSMEHLNRGDASLWNLEKSNERVSHLWSSDEKNPIWFLEILDVIDELAPQAALQVTHVVYHMLSFTAQREKESTLNAAYIRQDQAVEEREKNSADVVLHPPSFLFSRRKSGYE